MELNSNLREITTSYISSTLFSENYMIKHHMNDELLPFESCSSKGTYLRDFHHLDHQFHVNGLSLLNPNFSSQIACAFDPYDPYTYGGSSTNHYFYDYKSFVADQNCNNSGHSQVMDNFQSGEHLNFTNRNIIDLMGSDYSYFLPLIYEEIIKPMNFVVPDEASSITAENRYFGKVGTNKTRSNFLMTRSSYKGNNKSNLVKGQWTIEEDRLLIQMVEEHGVRKWSHIAQMLPGRIGKQCRERWHNHLRPDIKKDTWSEEEDKILIEAHQEIGNKWAEIAKRLPGRTENSIKNHWNATKRRQYSKRKCRSKYPRSTLLQDYIKSLNLDSPHKMGKYNRKTSTCSANNSMNTAKKLTPVSLSQQVNSPEIFPNDQMVSNYDFDEDPEFCFDNKIFEDSYTIDSLLDDTPCVPVVGQNNFAGKLIFNPPVVVSDHEENSQMEVEMNKQEMDLVEMILQANENIAQHF